MRILILDTYYPEPLELIYQKHLGLEDKPYAEQLKAVYDFGFSRADFLPLNLRKLHHEADQVIINSAALQQRWAKEHGVRLAGNGLLTTAARVLEKSYSGLKRVMGGPPPHRLYEWESKVLTAQVELFKPDVIFICDVLHLPVDYLKQIKKSTRLLVGEMAYPIPAGIDLSPFDLIFSAAPHYVERIRKAGIHSELLRLGFEASILERLGPAKKTEGAVFIGSVSSYHQERMELLEEVTRRASLSCWGYGTESLPETSALRGHVRPPLWGFDMFRQLQRAKIALNIHIDMAEKYAANMRLYEATGVGTLLVTDWKSNLAELFEPGKEVVAYKSAPECAELIAYYLQHDDEREAIARAGQQRTLREHTYYNRMQELTAFLERYL